MRDKWFYKYNRICFEKVDFISRYSANRIAAVERIIKIGKDWSARFLNSYNTDCNRLMLFLFYLRPIIIYPLPSTERKPILSSSLLTESDTCPTLQTYAGLHSHSAVLFSKNSRAFTDAPDSKLEKKLIIVSSRVHRWTHGCIFRRL